MTKVKRYRGSSQIDDLNGRQIIDLLTQFCEKHGVKPEDVSLERDYCEYSCKVTFETYTLETDVEYQERLDRERQVSANLKIQKIRQYERLKKELGYE